MFQAFATKLGAYLVEHLELLADLKLNVSQQDPELINHLRNGYFYVKVTFFQVGGAGRRVIQKSGG